MLYTFIVYKLIKIKIFMEQENFENNIDNKNNKSKKSIWVLKWTLVVGIVIVLNLFFTYAIKVFYPEPQYNNFCKEKQVRIVPDTKADCLTVGGQWTDGKYIQKNLPGYNTLEIPIIKTESKGYCNPDFTCRQNYENATSFYGRNVFVALVILGVVSIIGSLFIASIEAVALGFSLGGVLALIIGTVRYWSAMDDYLRVVVLAIALIALIWIGIKKFK